MHYSFITRFGTFPVNTTSQIRSLLWTLAQKAVDSRFHASPNSVLSYHYPREGASVRSTHTERKLASLAIKWVVDGIDSKQ
jgi:hypothetical protein